MSNLLGSDLAVVLDVEVLVRLEGVDLVGGEFGAALELVWSSSGLVPALFWLILCGGVRYEGRLT